ncbi:MAG: HyaD/HybD family hydrogenase maturation endopeptidase [Sulfurimonadaceae bacterium]
MKILILGIGNILFADEGIGVHIVNYMQEKYRFDTSHQVDLLDGGTLAQHLIPIIVEYDYLIIIDTVNAPGVEAGEVYFFDFEDVPNGIDWQGSAHEVEMLQTLTMMDLVGDRPTTKIIGIVPTIIEPIEFSLSDGVDKAVHVAEQTLIKHLSSLGIDTVLKKEITINDILPISYKMHYEHSL